MPLENYTYLKYIQKDSPEIHQYFTIYIYSENLSSQNTVKKFPPKIQWNFVLTKYSQKFFQKKTCYSTLRKYGEITLTYIQKDSLEIHQYFTL